MANGAARKIRQPSHPGPNDHGKSRILFSDFGRILAADTPKRSYTYLGPTLEKAPTSRKLNSSNLRCDSWIAIASGDAAIFLSWPMLDT